MAGRTQGRSQRRGRQPARWLPMCKKQGAGHAYPPLANACVRESKVPSVMTSGHDSTASLQGSWTRPPRGPPRFVAGDLLSGRYKVVRFIAEGGMGEVYEAEDLALGEKVALKTVRPDVAGDGKAIERFKREIQLARKVTH